MSLMRLLAAGSSLRGLKDRRSPYKMTQQHLLPKFNGNGGKGLETKAPPAPGFAGPVLPKTQSPSGDLTRGEETPADSNESAAMGIIRANIRTEPAEVAMAVEAPSQALAQSGQVGNSPGSTLRKRSWNLGGIPSLWNWAIRKNPFQSKGSDGKEPVQAELRLETIRVVRNDLNEADLEVIAPSKASAKQAADHSNPTNPEAARLVWQRIATRLFGSRRT